MLSSRSSWPVVGLTFLYQSESVDDALFPSVIGTYTALATIIIFPAPPLLFAGMVVVFGTIVLLVLTRVWVWCFVGTGGVRFVFLGEWGVGDFGCYGSRLCVN